MFEKNRWFCISAIVLCCAWSAGCNRAIDVAGQETRATENTLGKNTTATNSDFASDFVPVAIQNQHRGSYPAAAKNEFVDQPSSVSRLNSNASDASNPGNSVVNTLRVWRDRDLQYATSAELLEISLDTNSVKLLKENGIAITVPIARLSEHDKNFVLHFLATKQVD
jgi:hypothetical protein